MRTNNLFFILSFLMLNFASCQTKKVINMTKYENLTLEKKLEVDEYIDDAKKLMTNNKNEVVLLFQYNCFFGKKIIVNNIYSKDFPRSKTIHYGQGIVNFSKKLGKIRLKISDGKYFIIPQKKGYDFITICYNEGIDTIYIHYYDYPKMLIGE